MKAIIYQEYGSPKVLHLKEVEKPIPTPDEVLVKIHAASVNSWDWDLLRGKPFLARLDGGIRKPKHPILGADIGGTVEAVGENVKDFKPGDAVFGDISSCHFGGFAEYVCAKEMYLSLKPPEMTFPEAAALSHAGMLALQGLGRLEGIRKGDKVLINGAGGGVGTVAIQLAKYKDAEVTAVDHASKLDLLRAVGADHVIDYQKEDYTKNGQVYDLIIDVAAYYSVFDYQRALSPKGTFVMVGGFMTLLLPLLFWGALFSIFSNKKLQLLVYKPNRKDLDFLKALYLEGKLAPVIDKVYALHEVPQAIQYLGEGRVKGKLVVSMDPKE